MDYIISIMPSLITGAKMTLILFFWTLIVSIPLGIIVSLGLLSRFKPLRLILKFYIWIMRGTPLLLQLIFSFLWSANHWYYISTIRCCSFCFHLKLHCLFCGNISWWLSINTGGSI